VLEGEAHPEIGRQAQRTYEFRRTDLVSCFRAGICHIQTLTPIVGPSCTICRHATELALADQARTQGWDREVERHEAGARRIRQLLTDLNQPLPLEDPPTGPAT
jgi:hypothetical protein